MPCTGARVIHYNNLNHYVLLSMSFSSSLPLELQISLQSHSENMPFVVSLWLPATYN